MPSSPRALTLTATNALTLTIGLAFAAGAQAQESPYYIGASQAFTHDSNVFRAANGHATADSFSSTGLLGGLSLDLGRQHLYADATAAANRFQDLKQLNNTSYSLNTGLNWQTVEHLSGNLSLLSRQNLGQLGSPGSPQVKNVERLSQASASVRYGFTSHLGVEGGAEHRTLRYSFTTERELTERVGRFGLRWGTPGSLLTLGVGGRLTKGDAPHYRALLDPSIPELGFGAETPDSYNRKDIDFTAVWTPSALSTINGRISLTHENHTAITRPDLSGVTGEVSWDYKPTGKLALKAALKRDTGSQAVFTTSLLSSFLPVESNTSRINNLLNLDVNYELTAKIALMGNLAYNDSTTLNEAGRGFGSNSNKVALGARYQATRIITLGCNASKETFANYHDNTVGCSAQVVLR